MPLDNTADVDTPEQIRFRYRVAGPVRRAFAYLVDALVRAVIVVAVALFAQLALSVETRAAGFGVLLATLFVVEWGYYVVCETAGNGSSVGKRLLGLRVVKETGHPLGFLDSVLRNLMRAADFLPVGYGLGVLVMAGDARFRRLGDRVAGTMVVVEQRVALAQPLSLSPPATAEELAALPNRPPLAPHEREAVELFLRRADLSLARRHELAVMIAPLFARRMGLPVPADAVRFLGLLHERSSGRRA